MTIIEVLVVLAVLTILLTLALPPMARIRGEAKNTAALVLLRQHATVFTTYAVDYQGTYPFPIWPSDVNGTTTTRLTLGGFHDVPILDFFELYNLWHIALANQYYEGRYWTSEFFLPGSDGHFFTDYWYSSTFLTDPAYWRYETRTAGYGQIRPVKWHEVDYPSKKTLLQVPPSASVTLLAPHPSLQPNAFYVVSSAPRMAFVDGSARRVNSSQLMPPYFDVTAGSRRPIDVGTPGMHTIGGVQGRDVR